MGLGGGWVVCWCARRCAVREFEDGRIGGIEETRERTRMAAMAAFAAFAAFATFATARTRMTRGDGKVSTRSTVARARPAAHQQWAAVVLSKAAEWTDGVQRPCRKWALRDERALSNSDLELFEGALPHRMRRMLRNDVVLII